MESARARREEAIFYSLEQRSLRNRKEEMAGFERFASLAYDATTRYGQSLSRPIWWLFGLGVTFAFGYAWSLNPVFAPCAGIHLPYILSGLEYSVAQIVNPFGVWRYDYHPPGTDLKASASFALKLLATLESILTTAFLALFLRWR